MMVMMITMMMTTAMTRRRSGMTIRERKTTKHTQTKVKSVSQLALFQGLLIKE